MSCTNALLAKELEYGLAALSDTTNNNGPASVGADAPPATITGNATSGSLCGVNSAKDWHDQYPQFNILTGLPKLKQNVGDLRNVLQNQNKVMLKIISAIYKLDYCTPGPHPYDESSMIDQTVGNIMAQINVNNYSDDDEANAVVNAQFLDSTLGIKVWPNYKIYTIEQTQNVVREVVKRYFAAIDYEYHQNRGEYGDVPTVDDLASTAGDYAEYTKIPAYEQMMADNDAKTNLISGTIGQINSLMNEISVLSSSDSSTLAKIQAQFDALIPTLDVSPYTSSSH